MAVNPIIPLVEYFYLAGMHMAIGSYEKCLKNAVRYKNSPLADQRYMGSIDKMIENCQFAIEAIKNPDFIIVIGGNLPVQKKSKKLFSTLRIAHKNLSKIIQLQGLSIKESSSLFFRRIISLRPNLNMLWSNQWSLKN